MTSEGWRIPHPLPSCIPNRHGRPPCQAPCTACKAVRTPTAPLGHARLPEPTAATDAGSPLQDSAPTPVGVLARAGTRSPGARHTGNHPGYPFGRGKKWRVGAPCEASQASATPQEPP